MYGNIDTKEQQVFFSHLHSLCFFQISDKISANILSKWKPFIW